MWASLVACLVVLLTQAAGQLTDVGSTLSSVQFKPDTCSGRWMGTSAYATVVLQPSNVPSILSLLDVRTETQLRSFVQSLLTAPTKASWSSMQIQTKNAVIRDNHPSLEVIEELSVTLSPAVRSVPGLVSASSEPERYEFGISAVQARQPVAVRCVFKTVNMFYPIMLLISLLMWVYAPELAQSALFYYTSGA